MPPPSDTAVVRFSQLSKRFLLRRNAAGSVKELFLAALHPSRRETHRELWALRDVTFDIQAGEAVAFVGRNGSGKSTLLKLVAGITAPTQGQVLVTRDARIGTLIELGIGFHGELSARDNVYLNAAIHGLSRKEIDEVYTAILDYSGLADFADQPVRNFSSGMHMRLGFSVAMQLRPDILLLDEVFAVGDAAFQAQCLETMRAYRQRGGTLLFVSHEPESVRQICDRVIVLDAGAVVYDGGVDEGLEAYARLSASRGIDVAGIDDHPAPASVLRA